MKTLTQHLISHAVILAGWFIGSQCVAQTTYTQTNVSLLTTGANPVEKSATTSPNDFLTFSNAVRTAYATNYGGVFDFPTSVTTGTTLYRGLYATNSKRLHLTSSVTMQNSTAGGNTFTPSSGANLTTSSAKQSSYSLAIGPVVDPNTGSALATEAVGSIGFVILSRTIAAYPLDLRATVTFNDGSTQSALAMIGNPRASDDTFFGFSAPGDLVITNLLLQSFQTNTTTPVADRIGWDDFGFITKPVFIPPPPVVENISPANYAIHNASNGIQFQVRSYLTLDPANIMLILNASDVTGALVITGNATNRSVSYSGLLPNQEYTMTINATNATGAVSVTQTFYTATNAFTLFDCQGFTNDALYPLGALQAVTDGRGIWAPNAAEPAQIVDVGAPQGKALERLNTGLSRADFLNLPPLSSGTMIIEFDAWISTTLGRTIDIALMPLGSSGTTMASFLAWGEPAGKFAYFDNVNWLPLADLQTDWHHCKIINYLSGPSAGRYDVVINGLVVAQRLPWRNAVPGAAFSRLRIQSQNTGPVFESGRIDNLVITAAPEDPNAFPPPLIVPVSPSSDRAMVRTSGGLHFGVTSQLPVSATNIGVLLNGQDVWGALLLVSGPDTNRTVAYSGLVAETNYLAAISATNSAGPANLVLNFISTEQAWLYDPSDGWVGPWQYTSGLPEIRTGNPLVTNAPYLHLDILGGARNLMRQYTSSASVDIAQPHFIRWKFRLSEDDFAANFITFNDRVHFFARNAPRLTASTDAANSWAISATGAEQTPGSGVSVGQKFYIFDNRDGSGNYNLTNLVDSQIQLFPQHIYSFEVLVFPQNQTYSVAIVDETSSASFRSASPHLFRAAGVTATSHTLLHFGVQANTGTTPRPLDFGPVSVSAAAAPAVTLVNPVSTGGVFSFSFQSRTGVNHVTKYSADVTSSSWTSLVTNIGDGTLLSVSHTNPPPGRLFYRVDSQMP